MMKKLKKFFIIVLILGLVLFAALTVAGFWLTRNYKSLVEKEASHAIGRQVKVEKMGVSLFPPGAVIQGIKIAGLKQEKKDLLKIGKLKIGLSLSKLLSGKIDLIGLSIHKVSLEIIKDPRGRLNFPDILYHMNQKKKSKSSISIHIQKISFYSLRLNYRDFSIHKPQHFELSGLNGGISNVNFDKNKKNKDIRLEFQGKLAGQTFQVSGKISPFLQKPSFDLKIGFSSLNLAAFQKFLPKMNFKINHSKIGLDLAARGDFQTITFYRFSINIQSLDLTPLSPSPTLSSTRKASADQKSPFDFTIKNGKFDSKKIFIHARNFSGMKSLKFMTAIQSRFSMKKGKLRLQSLDLQIPSATVELAASVKKMPPSKTEKIIFPFNLQIQKGTFQLSQLNLSSQRPSSIDFGILKLKSKANFIFAHNQFRIHHFQTNVKTINLKRREVLKPQSSSPPDFGPSPLPFDFLIDQFEVLVPEVVFRDDINRYPFQEKISSLRIALSHISNQTLNGSLPTPYGINANVFEKGKFSAKGRMNLWTKKLNLTGGLKLYNVDITRFEPYYRDDSPIAIENGFVDFQSDFSIVENYLKANRTLNIRSLKVASKPGPTREFHGVSTKLIVRALQKTNGDFKNIKLSQLKGILPNVDFTSGLAKGIGKGIFRSLQSRRLLNIVRETIKNAPKNAMKAVKGAAKVGADIGKKVFKSVGRMFGR